MNPRELTIIGSDAGGTMTDMFVIDRSGEFAVGKASTTPKDESVGFWESLADACQYWGINWEKEAKDVLPGVLTAIYSGTAMLNTILTRAGKRVGIIITKGFEDSLLHERGGGAHAGYGYQDKLHFVTHVHTIPLVPKQLIKGVTERVSMFGEVVIPLYEEEARKAVSELVDSGVDGIAVTFLYSYLNPMNERRLGEIASEVMNEKGVQIPLYLSHEICPITREGPRLNAVVIQAYAADPAREQLLRIERKLQQAGYKHPLQVMLADGSIAHVRYRALFKACFSGPIGGILGGRFLSQTMNMPNLVCTDMGGTSFDVGVIMAGEPIIVREVAVARTVLNIPTLVMDSIGAGTGQYVRIDPESKRVDIGPDSAGADPGPVCYNKGNPVPTVMDCALIVGILNPDYYLGGRIKLRRDLALNAIDQQCARQLGVDPYDFAEGVIKLIGTRMKEHIRTVLSVRGYPAGDFHLIGYGGAGPMFLAEYTEGLPFKGVFTVPWAAAFSAFGLTATDYVHRYQKSTLVTIPPNADDAVKQYMGAMINSAWEELEETASKEMVEEGFKKEDIIFRQLAYVRYYQQLEDVEVYSPVSRLETAEDMDKLIAAFEDVYSRKYAHAAKFPEIGYQIFEVGLLAFVPKPKPVIRKYPLCGRAPSQRAFKGERSVYNKGSWRKAKLYEMDLLESGNEVEGLAIIEAPSTTLVVPEGKKVVVDEWKRFWLREA